MTISVLHSMAHFLQLAAKVSEATRSLVRDELVKAGLDVKEDEHDRDVLIVEASFDLLISEARTMCRLLLFYRLYMCVFGFSRRKR